MIIPEYELVMNIAPMMYRRWVCQVVRSGLHNGAGCRPSEPHGGWGCDWRFEVSVKDTPKNRTMMGISDKVAQKM